MLVLCPIVGMIIGCLCQVLEGWWLHIFYPLSALELFSMFLKYWRFPLLVWSWKKMLTISSLPWSTKSSILSSPPSSFPSSSSWSSTTESSRRVQVHSEPIGAEGDISLFFISHNHVSSVETRVNWCCPKCVSALLVSSLPAAFQDFVLDCLRL